MGKNCKIKKWGSSAAATFVVAIKHGEPKQDGAGFSSRLGLQYRSDIFNEKRYIYSSLLKCLLN